MGEDDIRLVQGDSFLEIDKIIGLVDAVITDPPYNISIVNREWDRIKDFEAWCYDWAKKCFVHMKPGAYLISFGSARTFHQLVSGIERAGFDITDCIIWFKNTGFPPNWNISKEFDERAGVKGKVVRVEKGKQPGKKIRDRSGSKGIPGRAYDSGVSGWSGKVEVTKPESVLGKKWYGWGTSLRPVYEPIVLAQKPLEGSFCDNIEKYGVGGLNIAKCSRSGFPSNIVDFTPVKNAEHPTTKPVELMSWLIDLVTAPDQLVLDPFMGSGSTAVACNSLGRRFIGIELEKQWYDLSVRRVAEGQKQGKLTDFPERIS